VVKSEMLNKEPQALASIIEQCNRIQGGKENVAVSFSGGKDSLVALDLAIRAGVTKAVFCDTTVEFDETIEYVEKVKAFYGINLMLIRGRVNFFESIERVGLPSRKARWCCDVHKFGPIAKYARDYRIKAFITGLRKDESKRRASYMVRDRNPMIPVSQINPLLDWTVEEVWEYIRTYNLPYNPLYDKGLKRIGCWCCPYKTDAEWKQMQELFPEKVRHFEEILEKKAEKLKIRGKKSFIKERKWASWVSPIRRKIVGELRPCEGNNGSPFDVISVVFRGDKGKNAKKVARLLPVLTDLFWVTDDSRVQVMVNGIEKKKLKILVEKAVNCFSCGACTSLCPIGALRVDDLSIYVEESICTRCGRCVNGGLLRGACIVRNYSHKPAAFIELYHF